jgi:hypothetical protein
LRPSSFFFFFLSSLIHGLLPIWIPFLSLLFLLVFLF